MKREDYKIGDRVKFAYAGDRGTQNGIGTIQKIASDGSHIGVFRDGDHREILDEYSWIDLWMIEKEDFIQPLSKLSKLL